MIPLREKKAAQTRLALLDALLDRIEDAPLHTIPVKALCAEVPCSEPTFFNHFKGKDHLIVFYIQLWSLEMSWLAEHDLAQLSALARIETLLTRTMGKISQRPGLMGEILAYQARVPIITPPRPLSRAEKVLAFPDYADVESLEGGGLQTVIPPLLEAAVATGELPPDADLSSLFFAICSIFFGSPVVGRQVDLGLLEPMLRRQLHWLWAGIRQTSTSEAS